MVVLWLFLLFFQICFPTGTKKCQIVLCTWTPSTFATDFQLIHFESIQLVVKHTQSLPMKWKESGLKDKWQA